VAEGGKRPTIQVLSDETINRIAAGEVVEGPASVVKELVDNALDAGATRIEIEVEGGGQRLIRVVDDGHGMDQEEAELCLQRHATSKLRKASDLHSIRSMGFRGEAVPAIASVSRLILVTRPHDQERATRIEVHGGEIRKTEGAAARPGTRFEVRTLFFNTPARRKFQRSQGAEMAAIRELVSDFLLARPEVAFRLTRSGEPLLSTPGGLTYREALERVLEPGEVDLYVDLPEATHPELPFTIAGFLGSPSITRRNSRGIRLFVNRRPFYAPTMCRGVLEAYRNFLPKGRWPGAVLRIQADPRAVDVNVHPAKKEVRFTGFPKLQDWLVGRIRQALIEGGELRFEEDLGVPVSVLQEEEAEVSGPEVEGLRPEGVKSGGTTVGKIFGESSSRRSGAGPSGEPTPHWERETPSPPSPEQVQQALALFDPAPYRDLGQAAPDLVGEAAASSHGGLLVKQSAPEAPKGKLFPNGVRVLGQVFDSFMVVTDDSSLYYIDQHVAHERILFEHFQAAFARDQPPVQNLLIPLELEVPVDAVEVLEEDPDRLERYGFRVHCEGGRAYVESIPLFPRELPVREVLESLVTGLTEVWGGDPIHDEIEAMADMMSCKAAIKAGQRLSFGEMTQLCRQLFDTDYPLTCPHGRPVLLGISESELRRRFLRSG
jgi:DNA mismatch repair protein MutL